MGSKVLFWYMIARECMVYIKTISYAFALRGPTVMYMYMHVYM